MLNKKHFASFAALTISAMLLAGCQENAEPINIMSPAAANEPSASAPAAAEPSAGDTASVTPDETPSEIARTATDLINSTKSAEPTATVNLMCTLPDSAPSQMALYKTTPFWFEDGLPEELLLKDVNYKWEETRQNEYFPEISVPIYVKPENDLLMLGYNCNAGGDLYFDRYDDKAYGSLGVRVFEDYDINTSCVKSIDGMTPEEATAKSLELLLKLGITNLGTPDVYAVTADAANDYISSHTFEDKQGNIQEVEKWTSDDEVYYLRFPVMADGTPIAVTGTFVGGMTHYGIDSELWTSGTYVDVTIRKDGTIFDVDTRDVPSADLENIGTADINITAQQAFEIFENGHYAEDYSTSINVTDCSLVYVMTNIDLLNCEHVLKPMWKFEANYEFPHFNSTLQMVEYVDATTGTAIFEY